MVSCPACGEENPDGFRFCGFCAVPLNTGEALVVLDARLEQGEGFVTGDVVNTASRIQGAAPVGGIAVGGEPSSIHQCSPGSANGE